MESLRKSVSLLRQSFVSFRVCLSFFLILAVWVSAERLCEFDQATMREFVSASDAKYSVSDGAVKVITGHAHDWPGLTLQMPKGPMDLSTFERVSLDVRNLSDVSLKIALRVDDDRKDVKRSMTVTIEIAPGRTETLSTKLHSTPWVLDEPLELVGMRDCPKHQSKLDTSKVTQVIVFLPKPSRDYTFEFENLRAEGRTQRMKAKGFIPFVDEFGQFKHADWPGKIHSLAALTKAKEAEQADMKAYPSPDAWNQYGGWTKGPQLNATGFFRVEKQKGQWWLVDPTGRLFWSHGVDCVNFGSSTPISERESYFQWLPKEDDAFARFYGRGNWAPHGFYKGKRYRTFDFAAANLMRKYGEDFYETTAQLCHRRLRSWGMNTIGNWSQRDIYLKRKTPYVATIHTSSRSIEGSEGYWGKFFDVFDPAFRQSLKKRIEAEKDKSIGDPWCIGFFVHNELSWGNETSLAVAALKSPADQHAKKAFVKVLREKYETIEKLNRAWGSGYGSWDGLLKSRVEPDKKQAHGDLTAFYTMIAETYFRIIREELKAAAPHQLYLGCRFAWANDRAVKAAAKYCDVVSYNRYAHSIRSLPVPKGLEKPIIIGEFHFGALDRGMFHTGLVACTDQRGRAQKYREYVFGALRDWRIVGTHWFQYRDQALTGRGDGENYQIGLVDGCDNPYPETIEALREVGNILYEYRYDTSHFK